MTRFTNSNAFARPWLACISGLLILAASGTTICLAQPANPASAAASAATAGAIASAPLKPAAVAASAAASSPRPLASKPQTGPRMPAANTGWNELTPPQQQALKPLQSIWGTLTQGHKRKWLAVSQTYPKMAPAEQATLHSRMTEWTGLSTRQRSEARLNFAEVKQHSPDEKKAKWEAYQALSPEERQKLAAGAMAKPQGAAPAVKPVPPQKLASVPPGQSTHKHPSIAGTSGKLDQNTLLPQPALAPTDAPARSN
ncbi:MAG: DUF3106 domain-containing protein [Bdellovibrionales bacterium]|nr:DUF3106 domain-containing protein [Ramlibacter sp.]